MKRRARLWAAILTAAVALCGGMAATADRPALAADDTRAARESVGKPVQQAQQLLKEKKIDQALSRLRAADAVPDKTPYERYVIEETRAAAYVDSGDYPAAIKSLEAVLTTGVLPPAEAAKRMLAAAQLAYQVKDYATVVEYADRYYRTGGTDEQPRLLMAQAYYVQNDFANAAKTVRAVIRSAEATGKAPSENALLMLASSEFKRNDQSAYIDALEQLVAHYPKSEYWRDLLPAIARRPGFAARLTLDLDLLMVATGAMASPDQYMNAAELALAAGLPGAAAAILDQGYATGILGKGGQADRQQRLVAMAKRQSNEDMKGLAQLRGEADAASSGLPWEKLGEAYASYGQYDNAVAAFRKAIEKGGLKYPEDAKLHLGVAYLRAGQRAPAKTTLDSVAGADGIQDLARLWLLQGSAK